MLPVVETSGGAALTNVGGLAIRSELLATQMLSRCFMGVMNAAPTMTQMPVASANPAAACDDIRCLPFDQHGALPDQKIPHLVQHQHRLLIHALDGNEAHRR